MPTGRKSLPGQELSLKDSYRDLGRKVSGYSWVPRGSSSLHLIELLNLSHLYGMMMQRISKHIFFWLAFVALYALVSTLFPSKSDLVHSPLVRYFRSLANQLLFLPWKILPFYLIYYVLVPYYLNLNTYRTFTLLVVLTLFISIGGYRLTVKPASFLLYQEWPTFHLFSVNRLLYTFVDLIPAFAIASSLKMVNERRKNQEKARTLEYEKTVAELKFLKAQIHPHFLFNTLNNLYGLARRSDEQTAPSIMKLAHLMRYILQESNNSYIHLEHEIRIIMDYLELEQLRFDKDLSLSFHHQVADPNFQIAPLILMPFVENAFKHGASESSTPPIIRIELKQLNEQLTFKVINSVDQDKVPNPEGFGLNNVKRRLELLYANHYDLVVNSSPGKFEVALNIKAN